MEFASLSWRKSTYSGAGGNDNCVEVAFAGEGVALRDTKNRAAGALLVPDANWLGFLSELGKL